MSNLINDDWFRVAKSFSDTDLRAHPNTYDIMSYFSDDVIFVEPGRYDDIGKNVARLFFKVFCEWGVLEYRNLSLPTFSQEDDHIVWSFDSIQLRKEGILPTWLKSPRPYNIRYTAHLYFSGKGKDCKISKYITIRSIWNDLSHSDIQSGT